MKRTSLSITILFSILILVSCKGVFRNGDIIYNQERPIAKPFDCIQINDNISVTLKEDTCQYVEITSGKFVIDKLTAEVIGDTLVLHNNNRFDWLRSYNCPFEMIVHYKNLGIINYQSTGDLRSLDSIRGYYKNDFRVVNINIKEGSGDIDLMVSCNNVGVYYEHGTSKFILRGKVYWSEISTHGFGPIEAENLKSMEVYFSSTSTCYAKVWAIDLLKADLNGLGYLYYKGNPDITCNDPDKLKKIL